MKFGGLKVKFIISFGIMLALICGVGVFSLFQFERMARLNYVTNSETLPSVAAGGRLDAELSSIRRADAEHMLGASPASWAEAEKAIANSKTIIAADLEYLPLSINTDEERYVVTALAEKMPQFFRASDHLILLSRARHVPEAEALFTGELDGNFRQMNKLIDRFVAINSAQAQASSLNGVATEDRSLYVILCVMLLAIVAAMAVFAVLVRTVISPLVVMTREMGELSAGNANAAVSSPVREDEIGRLAHAVTQFKATAIVLRAAKEEAEAGNRAKSAFLANMSHELRTPLNAIIGFSDLMLAASFGPIGNPRCLEYIADIQKSGCHLLKLVNDILDLSCLDAGQCPLQEQEISIEKLLSDVEHMVVGLADNARVKVLMDAPRGLCHLFADERRVCQIVLNLLSNAIKFTPEGGSVVVKASETADGLMLQVRDTGMGIARKDVSVALERFSQVDSHLARRHEGAGLGLPLTNQLVALHGGTLTIVGEIGIGTIATVIFPPRRSISVAAAIAA
jgi:signal transduction histidine kinase